MVLSTCSPYYYVKVQLQAAFTPISLSDFITIISDSLIMYYGHLCPFRPSVLHYDLDSSTAVLRVASQHFRLFSSCLSSISSRSGTSCRFSIISSAPTLTLI
ncbi:hypothetical protein RCL1_003153 [Eukaryota sp. TZLM3-RCL]